MKKKNVAIACLSGMIVSVAVWAYFNAEIRAKFQNGRFIASAETENEDPAPVPDTEPAPEESSAPLTAQDIREAIEGLKALKALNGLDPKAMEGLSGLGDIAKNIKPEDIAAMSSGIGNLGRSLNSISQLGGAVSQLPKNPYALAGLIGGAFVSLKVVNSLLNMAANGVIAAIGAGLKAMVNGIYELITHDKRNERELELYKNFNEMRAQYFTLKSAIVEREKKINEFNRMFHSLSAQGQSFKQAMLYAENSKLQIQEYRKKLEDLVEKYRFLKDKRAFGPGAELELKRWEKNQKKVFELPERMKKLEKEAEKLEYTLQFRDVGGPERVCDVMLTLMGQVMDGEFQLDSTRASILSSEQGYRKYLSRSSDRMVSEKKKALRQMRRGSSLKMTSEVKSRLKSEIKAKSDDYKRTKKITELEWKSQRVIVSKLCGSKIESGVCEQIVKSMDSDYLKNEEQLQAIHALDIRSKTNEFSLDEEKQEFLSQQINSELKQKRAELAKKATSGCKKGSSTSECDVFTSHLTNAYQSLGIRFDAVTREAISLKNSIRKYSSEFVPNDNERNFYLEMSHREYIEDFLTHLKTERTGYSESTDEKNKVIFSTNADTGRTHFERVKELQEKQKKMETICGEKTKTLSKEEFKILFAEMGWVQEEDGAKDELEESLETPKSK